MTTSRLPLLAFVAMVTMSATACLAATEPGVLLDCSTLATTLGTTTNLQATPTGLRYRDVVPGTGAEIVDGNRVVTRYSACVTSGELFSAVSSPSNFVFTVGAGQVIAGLDEGVRGMKIGGLRQLVIPPELGYGSAGSPGGFPVPNETLVITVQVSGLR